MNIESVREKLKEKHLPEQFAEIVQDSLERLEKLEKAGSYFQETDSLSRWLNIVLSIPWEQETKQNIDLKHAKQILDKNHFGLEVVKERVLEYLAVQRLRQEANVVASEEHSPVLCFVGLQGVGKTTLAYSIAEALERKIYRISLGAIGSIVQIRGQRRSLADSEPGQVIKAIIRSGVKNPVILLDEMDKVSAETGLRQDVMSVLLEVLDPAQNVSFIDHYLDYPFDLSKALFIATANTLETFTTALMDRLEIIQMPSYYDREKEVIGKNYLLPKILSDSGLKSENLSIDENVWPKIIRPLGFDAGVRTLDRNISTISRKVAKKIVMGEGTSFRVSLDNIKEFLETY